MLKRWIAWWSGWLAWSGAFIVLAVTTALVILDLDVASVHRFWSRHSFTSSVLAGVLVVFLTVLIVDRVVSIRKLRDQSLAMGAQAAVILAQAVRAKDAVSSAKSEDDRDRARDELHTYAQMLLTSAPLLIDAAIPRTFLEAAQRMAALLSRALHATGDGQRQQANARLDHGMTQLRKAAAPLTRVLDRAQRAAVSSEDS